MVAVLHNLTESSIVRSRLEERVQARQEEDASLDYKHGH